MIAIRKFGWTAVALAAFVGCSKEEPASTTPPPTTVTPPPTVTPPATAVDAKPPFTKAEKEEMPKEEKKDGGLKLEAPAVTPAPAPAKDDKKPEAKDDKKADDKDKKAEAKDDKKADDKKDEAKGDKKDDKAAAAALTGDEIAEIKKLPEAEQKVALAQLLCPVSGEHLGSMDMPVKVDAEGKTFYLCCKSCMKELKADPKAVVAKLSKK